MGFDRQFEMLSLLFPMGNYLYYYLKIAFFFSKTTVTFFLPFILLIEAFLEYLLTPNEQT